MTAFNSLHEYLDYQLPSSISIVFRNFFSFLPFVTPVDIREVNLRNYVNNSNNSEDYISYFENNRKYFKSAFNSKDTFFYSKNENKIKSQKPDASRVIISALGPAITAITTMLRPEITTEEDEYNNDQEQLQYRSYLNDILALLAKDDWDQQLSGFLDDISQDDRIRLVKELIHECINPTKPSLQSRMQKCILKVTDGFDLDRVRKDIFENLQNSIDVKHFGYFLSMKADWYLKQLSSALRSLGKQTSPGGTEYGLYNEFAGIRRSLKEIIDQPNLYSQYSYFSSFEIPFRGWHEKAEKNNESKTFKRLVENINKYIVALKNIFEINKDPCFKELYIENEMTKQKNTNRFNDRIEFKAKVMEGAIRQISLQELREFYPEGDEYQKPYEELVRFCQVMSVTVVDTTELESNNVLKT